MSALVDAAREFEADELRRRRRSQRPRIGTAHLFSLRGALRVIGRTTTKAEVENPHLRVARGLQAVELFGYTDTADENAATVITDILHAVAAAGYSPQAVLNQAAAYYAEERETPQDAYALTR